MENAFKSIILQLENNKENLSIEKLISLASVYLNLSETELPEEVADPLDIPDIYESLDFSESVHYFNKFVSLLSVVSSKWDSRQGDEICRQIFSLFYKADQIVDSFMELECEEFIQEDFKRLYSHSNVRFIGGLLEYIKSFHQDKKAMNLVFQGDVTSQIEIEKSFDDIEIFLNRVKTLVK